MWHDFLNEDTDMLAFLRLSEDHVRNEGVWALQEQQIFINVPAVMFIVAFTRISVCPVLGRYIKAISWSRSQTI